MSSILTHVSSDESEAEYRRPLRRPTRKRLPSRVSKRDRNHCSISWTWSSTRERGFAETTVRIFAHVSQRIEDITVQHIRPVSRRNVISATTGAAATTEFGSITRLAETYFARKRPLLSFTDVWNRNQRPSSERRLVVSGVVAGPYDRQQSLQYAECGFRAAGLRGPSLSVLCT
jgi:hypothetical protein